MVTRVEKSIVVDVPVSVAYNQWTQFEEFPHFMSGVQSITQLSDTRQEWVAEIAGVRRRWEAQILEQVPDRKVAWAATEGATNAGAVTFEDLGGQTRVNLELEYEPEGLVEKVGDFLNVVERQASGDLDRFKAFIEAEGYATGAWRGTVAEGSTQGAPGVAHAAASLGDSGSAGVSGKAVAAGLGVAAAAAAAALAATKKSGESGVEATDVPATTVTSHTEVREAGVTPDAAVRETTPVAPMGTTESLTGSTSDALADPEAGAVHLTDAEVRESAGRTDRPLA
ncbi:hypothetical protein NUM3379_20560 [Kineococcus sp. NUM-3379]